MYSKNMHLIVGVIVVFGSYFTRADVHELQVNERAYLPPDNKEHLPPPSEKEVKEVVNSQNNQCNLPMIIYNGPPPPIKVKSKLNNEYLPPSKEEVKVLMTKVNNQPKVAKANDPVRISPKLPQIHSIQDLKTNQTKVLANNDVTIKQKPYFNREYLPPTNGVEHTNATAQGYQHNQPKAIPDPLPISQHLTTTMNGPSYQHNQPKAIDDPPAIRVNYIQPLRLDFLDGQLKPIAKGPLFTGLFLNASEIKLSTERIPKKIRFNQTKPKPFEVNSNSTNSTTTGKEAVSQTKEVNYELKTDHSLQNTKYHKKFEDDIVLINYPDATTNFKLFNSDDDTLLSGSAPEVIFKPGDDISFVHDTSIIDDYEHMPAKAKKTETITTTTAIPLPLEAFTAHDDQDAQGALEAEQSNETESSLTAHGYAGYSYEKPKYEPIHDRTTKAGYSYEKPKYESIQEQKTEAGYSYEKPKYDSIQEQTTEAGYSYEKPKYESIQEQTTEALRRQADECGVTEMEQPNTEITEIKPHSNEKQITADDTTSTERQSNENDHSDAGAGYFYEKPKIPFTF